jgi:hypothetical protein
MLEIQASIPGMKAFAASVPSMAMDSMIALRTLPGDLRGRSDGSENELML